MEGIDAAAEERARREAEKLAAEAAAKERRAGRDLQLRRLAARFMREHVRPKRKPATVEFYRHALATHILPALGRKDAREITRQEVARLHNSLADRPAMANRVVAALSAIYGWAEDVELLPEGHRRPTTKIEKFREQAKEHFLSVEELQRLGAAIRQAETVGIPWESREGANAKHAPRPENRIARIDADAAAALRLLVFTGARLREILNLEWSAVDIERGLLRLRDSKTEPKTILLNGPARVVLVGLSPRGPFVFPGRPRRARAAASRSQTAVAPRM